QSKYGSKYRAIAKVSDGLPNVSSNLLVASQEFIDKQPDKLRAIMKTYKQAVDFVTAQPEKAAEVALKPMVNIDLASLTHATKRMAAAKFYGDGKLDAAGIAGTKKLLEATGEIKGAFDFEPIIDRRFQQH